MALCDLSNRNPNVLYELGIRQAYDKPVVLVQDEKTERIFDISGISTVPYSSKRLYEDVLENRRNITEAILSTKEGKQNSIIKVVNVKNAEIQKGEVSREDKIEILLSGLLEDVKEIKEYGVSPRQQIRVQQRSDWKDIALNDGESDFFKILLKHGITNKDIDKIMNDIKASTGIHIAYYRDRNSLLVKIYTDDFHKLHYVREMLLGRLCE